MFFSSRITVEFFYNYQHHKVDRSGIYFFPLISLVIFVLVTDKFDGVCYEIFLLIICTKRTDMLRYAQENKT